MTVDERDIKTYSLTEVANMVLPPDMKARERWLSQRLNRGELSGDPRVSGPSFVATGSRLPQVDT
jgi:hypothetical protein